MTRQDKLQWRGTLNPLHVQAEIRIQGALILRLEVSERGGLHTAIIYNANNTPVARKVHQHGGDARPWIEAEALRILEEAVTTLKEGGE